MIQILWKRYSVDSTGFISVFLELNFNQLLFFFHTGVLLNSREGKAIAIFLCAHSTFRLAWTWNQTHPKDPICSKLRHSYVSCSYIYDFHSDIASKSHPSHYHVTSPCWQYFALQGYLQCKDHKALYNAKLLINQSLLALASNSCSELNTPSKPLDKFLRLKK